MGGGDEDNNLRIRTTTNQPVGGPRRRGPAVKLKDVGLDTGSFLTVNMSEIRRETTMVFQESRKGS